jgi:hypothetical protein
MHLRELARSAWRKAGLYRTRDASLRACLDYFETHQADCWPDMVDAVRAICPNQKEMLVRPLWNTGDALLRANLIRAADLSQPDERTLLDTLLGRLDSRRDERELHIASRLKDAAILDRIARRRVISTDLRDVVTSNRARLAGP